MLAKELINPLDEKFGIHYVLSAQEFIDISMIVLKEGSQLHLKESGNEEAGYINTMNSEHHNEQ